MNVEQYRSIIPKQLIQRLLSCASFEDAAVITFRVDHTLFVYAMYTLSYLHSYIHYLCFIF